MENLDMLILIIECIVGVLLCFCGYRFKDTLMAVIWFVIGYLLVKQFGPYFLTDPKFLFVGSILGGLILAVFSFDLTAISEYLIGFYAGFTAITSFLGMTLIGIVIGVVVGVVCALIAQRFSKYIVILATAYLGASMIAPMIPKVMTIGLNVSVIALILFVIGALVQFLTNLGHQE